MSPLRLSGRILAVASRSATCRMASAHCGAWGSRSSAARPVAAGHLTPYQLRSRFVADPSRRLPAERFRADRGDPRAGGVAVVGTCGNRRRAVGGGVAWCQVGRRPTPAAELLVSPIGGLPTGSRRGRIDSTTTRRRSSTECASRRRRGRRSTLPAATRVAGPSRRSTHWRAPPNSRWPTSSYSPSAIADVGAFAPRPRYSTLVDAGAESPQETRVRLVLVAAGFPRPETQIPVYDEWGQLVRGRRHGLAGRQGRRRLRRQAPSDDPPRVREGHQAPRRP